MLGYDKLLDLVRKEKLLEQLGEREFSKSGGVAFDLRAGEILEFTGEGFLGINERKTPDTNSLGLFKDGESVKVTLKPNKYYLVQTVERVNCPKDIASIIISRSTLYRCGLLLLAGLTDPGYSGKLAFGLINLNSRPFTIELGSRIANMIFYKVDGKAKLYSGQYNGGIIGTDKV